MMLVKLLLNYSYLPFPYQNWFLRFNIASRSASGPPCGKRIVAGRIVKESYGAAKQQHTFTVRKILDRSFRWILT